MTSNINSNSNSFTTPQKVINLPLCQEQWLSPEVDRVARTTNGGIRVRSLAQNTRALRGGDFCLNQFDDVATLSVCFSKEGKKFGLTVAHIADKVDRNTNHVIRVGQIGDEILAFNSDEPQQSGRHDTIEIGKIVAIDRSTDSMIFQLHEEFVIDDWQVYPHTNLGFRIKAPTRETVLGALGTKLVGYGAQRRGTIGALMEVINNEEMCENSPLLMDDMCILSFDPTSDELADGRKILSDFGDCGMLYMDEYGTPYAMHHVLLSKLDGTFFSCAVPFSKIVQAHQRFMGPTAVYQSPPYKHGRFQSKIIPPTGSTVVIGRTTFKTTLTEVTPFKMGYQVVHGRTNINQLNNGTPTRSS